MEEGITKQLSIQELIDAFSSLGLKDGDVVYLSTQLYGIGLLKGLSSREEYLDGIYSALLSVIGTNGTIVVPTFTQQVGRFGLPFVLEETESLTGVFGEYIRSLAASIRSLHPVFSVTAIGPAAKDICSNVSPVAFGVESAFDRMVKNGAQAVCMGFDYYSGHIVSLMHLVETAFAVPYYYNKLVCSPVISNGVLIEKPFVINVKYLGMNCDFNFKKYTDALAQIEAIHTSPLGRGYINAVDSKVMFDTGISLLKEDVYSFLSQPPTFPKGQIPLDGPLGIEESSQCMNWSGYLLGQ